MQGDRGLKEKQLVQGQAQEQSGPASHLLAAPRILVSEVTRHAEKP